MTVALRAAAIAIAVLALLDPALAVKTIEPLPVELLTPPASDPGYQAAVAAAREIAADLAGRIDTTSPEPGRARVSIGGVLPPDLSVPLVALLPEEPPGVAITDANAAPVIEGQPVEVTVVLHGHALAGRTSGITLMDRGVAVARAEHTWTADAGAHEVTLSYAAPAAGVLPLAVRIETPGADPAQTDVAAVVAARRLRVLVYEPRPSWAAAFVRRSLEAEPRFVVAALSRSAPGIATRLGTAPRSLDALDPGSVDLAVIGAPEALTPAELTVLDRFAAVRGGTVLLLPDTRLSARVLETFELPRLEEKLLEAPVRIDAATPVAQGSELLLPPAASRTHTPIASVTVEGARRAVIFSVPRGEGAIAVSGLMDAWRYRGQEAERFWQGLLADLANQAPAPLSVRLQPALARPGDRIHLTATWRKDVVEAGDDVRVPATMASMIADDGGQTPLRVWPGERAGIYEAWIEAPAAGTYAVTVAGAGTEATATLRIDDSVRQPARGSTAVEAAAAHTGGSVARQVQEVAGQLARLPAPEVERVSRPMRSPWWVVPFAGFLCAEWLVRRRRGLR